MICKECGAYNPDHATYCKVCAANLKGEPAPETVEAPEEEQQPTKRFSRPSWVVPEQSERIKKTVAEPEEEPEEELPATEEEPEEEPEAIEPEAEAEEPEAEEEEPEEEPTVPLWTPSPRRRRAAVVEEQPEEEPEDDEPESEDDAPAAHEEEEEGIYNEEEALEDSEDSFEYEPTPPKHKQQKKKNNTLFTILLIAIIVVIVGILVLGGYMLLRNQLKCSKTSGQNNPGATAAVNTDTEAPSATSAPTPEPEKTLDATNAQLLEYRDENNADMIAITAVVPAKSTLTIDFPHQDDYKFENTEDKDVQRKVKIPVEVFYLNTPLEDPEVTFEPNITITAQDGSSYKVACPSFTRTFPKLNITVTSPVANEDGVIMAPESNAVTIKGTIDDTAAQVTINGVGTVIYADSSFMYDFTFPEGTGEDEEETFTIIATRNDCVSDTKEITIHAYKFVPEPMKLEVKSEGNDLRADKTGKLTVTGTTLPGATLTATSDNSTNVLCGSVNVDYDGNFSFQVTMDPEFYGMSVITVEAAKEGAESGSTKFTVTKGFADKDSFLKYYNKSHTYLEIPKNLKIAEVLANENQYASSAYGFRITATVVEVVEINGEIVVKMTLNKSGETVYVRNYSAKWAPSDNIGGKYNVYGNFTGTYSDTGCAEFIGWFAKKP